MGTIDDIFDRFKVCTIVKECYKSLVSVNHRSEGRPIIDCLISCCRRIGNGIESNGLENASIISRGEVVDVNNKKGKHLVGKNCITDCVVSKAKNKPSLGLASSHVFTKSVAL